MKDTRGTRTQENIDHQEMRICSIIVFVQRWTIVPYALLMKAFSFLTNVEGRVAMNPAIVMRVSQASV